MTSIRHLGILAFFIIVCPTLSVSSQTPDDIRVITPNCQNEAVLPCEAKSYSYDFMRVIWYKVIENKDRGIISKENGSQKPIPYQSYRDRASVKEDYSLILKNVTTEDAGQYKCHIRAKVGWTNNDTFAILDVSECVPTTTPTAVPTTEFTAASTTGGWTSAQDSVPAAERAQLVEVTPTWALVGFFTIGLTKAVLCALCIWGVVLCKNHRRKSTWS